MPTTPPTFPRPKSSDRSELIDINAASKHQLLTLPGIDESRAEKIIENRPCKKKEEVEEEKDRVARNIQTDFRQDNRHLSQEVNFAHYPTSSVVSFPCDFERITDRRLSLFHPATVKILESPSLECIATLEDPEFPCGFLRQGCSDSIDGGISRIDSTPTKASVFTTIGFEHLLRP